MARNRCIVVTMTVELTRPSLDDEEAINSLLSAIESTAQELPKYSGSDTELLSDDEARAAAKTHEKADRKEGRRQRQERRLGRAVIADGRGMADGRGIYYEPDNTLLTRGECRLRDGKTWFRRPTQEHNTEATLADADRRFDRRTALRLGGLVAIGAAIGAYADDVRETTERERLSRSRTSLVYEAKTAEGRRHPLKVTAGFGNGSSIPTAEAVQSYSWQHQVLGNVLGREGIDMNRLAGDTLEYMREHQQPEVSYAGFSMGGLMVLREAALIHDDEGPERVDTINVFCMPTDVSVLWPNIQASGYAMAELMSIVWGSEKSQIARFMVETFGARWSEIVMPSWAGEGVTPFAMLQRLANVSELVVRDKINNTVAASNRVARGQFAMIDELLPSYDTEGKQIVASGAEDSIRRLGKAKPGVPPPHIIYTRPLDNSADQTVNNDASVAKMREFTQQSGLPFIDIQVEGIHHADPIQTPKEHAFAIALAERAKGLSPTLRAAYREEIKTAGGRGVVTIYPVLPHNSSASD